jgi:uncharacterized protein (TIGR02246 family)
MQLHLFIPIAALAMAAAGCRSASVPPPISVDPTAVAAVRNVVLRIIAADNAGDLETAVACYTDDGQWLPPGAQPVVGRAALRESYKAMFAAWSPKIRVISDETWVLGNIAIDRGHTTGQLVSRTGGAPRTLDDKYIMILRRGEDGVWRIARLMWNSNTVPG